MKCFDGASPRSLGIPDQHEFVQKYMDYMLCMNAKYGIGVVRTLKIIDFYIGLDFWRLVGIFHWINVSNPNGRLSRAYPLSILRYLADLGLAVIQRPRVHLQVQAPVHTQSKL